MELFFILNLMWFFFLKYMERYIGRLLVIFCVKFRVKFKFYFGLDVIRYVGRCLLLEFFYIFRLYF